MNTDQDYELLEKAAKAIGRPFERGITELFWNPLQDDRDAFRLMVECALTVEVGLADVNTCAGSVAYHGVIDAYTTVRLAIVEAAAAQGCA